MLGLLSFRVKFTPGALIFSPYPFGGASVRRRPRLEATEVAEVLPGWFPPAVVTRDGEVLFVPAAERDALVSWARAHALPFMDRGDPWEWLLEPYLDTEFTPAQARAIDDRLNEMGFDDAEIARLRRRVGPRMQAFVAATWEWMALGLFDLLTARLPFEGLFGRGIPYDEAMAVALRGGAMPLSEARARELLKPSALAGPHDPAGSVRVRCCDAHGRRLAHGYVTLESRDASYRSVEQFARKGEHHWQRVRPGAYRLSGVGGPPLGLRLAERDFQLEAGGQVTIDLPPAEDSSR